MWEKWAGSPHHSQTLRARVSPRAPPHLRLHGSQGDGAGKEVEGGWAPRSVLTYNLGSPLESHILKTGVDLQNLGEIMLTWGCLSGQPSEYYWQMRPASSWVAFPRCLCKPLYPRWEGWLGYQREQAYLKHLHWAPDVPNRSHSFAPTVGLKWPAFGSRTQW